MDCPKCKHELVENQRWCDNCGHKISKGVRDAKQIELLYENIRSYKPEGKEGAIVQMMLIMSALLTLDWVLDKTDASPLEFIRAGEKKEKEM